MTTINTAIQGENMFRTALQAFSGAVGDTTEGLRAGIATAIHALTASGAQGVVLQTGAWKKFCRFWSSVGLFGDTSEKPRFSVQEYREYSEGMRAHLRTLIRHGMERPDAVFIDQLLQNRILLMAGGADPGRSPAVAILRQTWTLQRLEKRLALLVEMRRSGLISSRDLTLASKNLKRDILAVSPLRVIADACSRIHAVRLGKTEQAEYIRKQITLVDLQFSSICRTLGAHRDVFSQHFCSKSGQKYREVKRVLKDFRKRIPGLILILQDMKR